VGIGASLHSIERRRYALWAHLAGRNQVALATCKSRSNRRLEDSGGKGRQGSAILHEQSPPRTVGRGAPPESHRGGTNSRGSLISETAMGDRSKP
jgi:hypothetical protein